MYNFMRDGTRKLRSLGKRFTRRFNNRIAPAPATDELPPLDPIQASSRQESSRNSRRRFTSRTSNRIAPAPATDELPPLVPRQASPSSRQASSSSRQASPSSRQASPSSRQASPSSRQASPSSRQASPSSRQASPRQRSSSPRTKTRKRELAARKLQKSVRNAKARAIVREEECAICLSPMLYPRLTRTLICGHTFHRKCINEWINIEHHTSCPTCRQSIEPKRKHHLQQFIPIPGSATISDIKRANALIKGLRNAATIDEALLLLSETDIIINNMQISDKKEMTEAVRAVWYETEKRLQQQQPSLTSTATAAIKSADDLIDKMYEASSLIEAHSYVNSSTRIIDSLANLGVPQHEITRLIDKQWYAWLIVHRRFVQR